MIRGGNWNNGANAGVFYFNGNNSRANVNWNVGFRSALALFVIVCELRLSRNTKAKGTHFPADKAKDKRPCGSLVEATGSGGQTAQAGRTCKQVKDGRNLQCGSCKERPIQGVSHAGRYFDR